jgi:hypothetical protein
MTDDRSFVVTRNHPEAYSWLVQSADMEESKLSTWTASCGFAPDRPRLPDLGAAE